MTMKCITANSITLILAGWAAACLAAGPHPDVDFSKVTAKDFDNPDWGGNGNGRLDRDEFARYQFKRQNPPVNDVDTNNDYKITENEVVAWSEKYWLDVSSETNEPAMTFAAADSTIAPSKTKNFSFGDPKKGAGQIRLRKDYDGILKDLDKADPATFGYYDNRESDEDTWVAQATLGLIRSFDVANKDFKICNYGLENCDLVGALSMDRVTGKGDGTRSEVDSLVGRVGLAFGLGNNETITRDYSGKRDGFLDYLLFSLAYRTTTTTEAKDYKHGLELLLEPIRSREGDLLSINGAYRPLGIGRSLGTQDSFFLYRFVFLAKSEVGESINELDGETFAKAGPKLGLYLQPTAFNRLELFGDYTYLWEFADCSRDFDYLETGGRVALDKAKQVFIEIKKRLGQVPAKYTDIDLWQATLSVRF